MKKRIYLDLHVIQSVPPSCLNRDDTGSPKTAIYGGARRARVSSQAWKRAMRVMFKDYFNESELGIRTLLLFDVIADEIQKINADISREEAVKKAEAVLSKAKVNAKKTSAGSKAEALFFIAAQQVKNLARLAMGDIDDKKMEKEIIGALKSGNSVDIALFGRMVASNPSLNCDASAQVAHAISTHRIENEYDFFTAVDDLSPEDNAGAGMLGTVEYHSATLYRYATVAAHELFEQLTGNTELMEKAVNEFTRAFVYSMPTGKQNTFAAQTVPDALLVAVRTDRPVNLAGAFEAPVRGEGFVASSAREMVAYTKSIYEDFCPAPKKSYIVGKYLDDLGERITFDGLLGCLGKDVVSELVRL